MRVRLSLVAAGLIAASAASAQVPAPGPDVPIAWLRTPSAADVEAALPAAARGARDKAKVVLACRLQVDGNLRGCQPQSEEPAGLGLGAAALALVPKFTAYALSTGRDIDIRLPIAFSQAAGAPRIVQRPVGADYSALIAKASADKTVTKADVVLDCKVGGLGELTACKPVSESPAGLGLAGPAVELASRFRMSLWGANGRPSVGASVRLPLQVQVRDDNNVAATTLVGPRSRLSADLAVADRLASDLGAYYPERALSAGMGGDATVRCKPSSSRILEGCTVVFESPRSYAFGAAAMKLASRLALKPDAEARPAADGTVLVPFSFRVR
jgi:TonB family protein